MKYPNNTAVGATAVTLGLLTAITPAWATTTPVGAGFTLGLGAMTVIYGTWSLIARDPTRDHWALSVVGLVLGISPWVGGYAGIKPPGWPGSSALPSSRSAAQPTSPTKRPMSPKQFG